MSTENNKVLIKDMVERINASDFAGAGEHVAEDLINHGNTPEAQGRKGLVSVWEKATTAFPDTVHTVEDMVAEGDRVTFRLRLKGTNTGEIGFNNLKRPATGKSFETEHINICRFDGGKIVEMWGARDDIGLFRQLGLLPAMMKAALEA